MEKNIYYKYISNKVSAARKLAEDIALDIEHPGLKGDIREIALKNCIEPFLTHSFKTGTGKILDSYETFSDQIDIIIYHNKLVPPVFINQDLGIYPVESVRYAFEVKSKLTAKQIKDFVKKFDSIKRLKPFPRKEEDGSTSYGKLPASVLFAFSSDIKGLEIDRYLKYDTYESSSSKVLCVLGKGYWYYNVNTSTWYSYDTSNFNGYPEFICFITGFMNTLSKEESTIRSFTPGDYVFDDSHKAAPIRSK